MTELTHEAESFSVEHAYRHKLHSDDRESLAHMILMPEHGIAGFIYPTMRANGNARGRAYLFGPELSQSVTEVIEKPLVDSMDFDDWRVGPMLMAVREPHQTVDLQWKGGRVDFEGRFEAMHPPYAFSFHPGANPPYYGDDRTEQHGRLVADLTVDGRTLKHEGFMIRDHSWGPRVWGLNQHHKWLHAVTPDCSIHVFEMQSFGKTHQRGYVYRDAAMAHIVSVEYEITYDSAMMHQGFQAQVVDADGRTVSLDCKTFASIQLDSYDDKVYLNEAALEVSIDGSSGTGWAEFCWNRSYLDFAKEYVTQYAGR